MHYSPTITHPSHAHLDGSVVHRIKLFVFLNQVMKQFPDIYPILGSLLGVDTSPQPSASSGLIVGGFKDEEQAAEFYGYLNHNRNVAGGSSLDAPSLLERDNFMQCKHCNRYYKSHQKLQEHVRKYCLKEKKYKCVSCDYRSRRKDHVLRHAKRKHSEMFERARDDEERLYEIRGHEEGIVIVPTNDGGDYDGGDYDETFAPVTSLGFSFNNRDLTITAVPVLHESEDDDDDYDEDGE